MDFNQDQTLIAIYNKNEIKVINVEPYTLRTTINIPNTKIVNLFYRTNLIFFVGNDNLNNENLNNNNENLNNNNNNENLNNNDNNENLNNNEKLYPANILNIYDDSKKRIIDIIKMEFEIDKVYCTKTFITLISNNYLYLYKFNNLINPYSKILVSNNNYCIGNKYLIYIVKNIDNNSEIIKIKNLETDVELELKAHENKIKFMAINKLETLLATSSERGTIIRVFDIETGKKLYEFRRGTCCSNILYISFSDDLQFLSVISDRGTIHIYNLKNVNSNRKSILSVLGGYFDSEWSFAWFYNEPVNKAIKCCFNYKNELLIIMENNDCYKLLFDQVNGGKCYI